MATDGLIFWRAKGADRNQEIILEANESAND